MSDFTIKDSGARVQLAGGMVRDTSTGKTNPSLVLDGPMFFRWVTHLDKGAVKYEARNWMKCLTETDTTARSTTETRFRESAIRHFFQWLRGDRDEDHAAAVFFNINGFEALKEQETK